MKISEAKQISIVEYLTGHGIEPDNWKGDNAWYHSPLRPGEKTPSFKVNTKLNRWIDFGDYRTLKGDIIDLVSRLNNVSLKEALHMVGTPGPGNTNLFFLRGETHEYQSKENRIEIKHVQTLQNKALISYLESRNISFNVAKRYVQECYFTIFPDQKIPYFAIYFRNDKGGAELRNGYKTPQNPDGYKLSVSPKYITTIQKTNSGLLSIYEGFMDFLSAVEYFRATPGGTAVVLNSVVNIPYVYPLLDQYSKVSLFFDNDKAGEKATRDILARHPKATDFRGIIYDRNKDFNEFLMNKNQIL